MRARALTDRLALTEVGFGAACLGNLYSAISDEQSEACVDAAWDAGIRYFDTAPHYGLGLSERRLGRALAGRPRDEFTLSTKVGRLLVPRLPPLPRDDDMFDVPGDLDRVWDFSAGGIRRSIEESLTRLGLDHIDIAYLHDPDVSAVPGALADGLEALLTLRAEGLVTAVGVGTNDPATVVAAFADYDIDTAMLAGRYTLLREAGFAGVVAAAAGRPVVLAGVFNSGILAREEVPADATLDYLAAPADVVDRARRIAALAAQNGTTLPALAIQHGLRHPATASVVLGMSSPEQVAQNVARYGEAVPPQVWAELGEVAPPR
ncbi:aldo/keto reductase [Ruania zhangjianzhongii]|uniref:aldo/keto reductase n=1 Tax=Ruania zhangjianzhongii TaxID=2603206 RepID=UPI0011C802F0|nr:aldo/keto reductase [Ruania zhangjianzhongii]